MNTRPPGFVLTPYNFGDPTTVSKSRALPVHKDRSQG